MKTLLEIFRLNENDLKPEQEKLVDDAATDIIDLAADAFGTGAVGASGKLIASKQKIVERLRQLLRASEGAEGEDPKEIEVGFNDLG